MGAEIAFGADAEQCAGSRVGPSSRPPEFIRVGIRAVPDFQNVLADYFPSCIGAMNQNDNELASDIERERGEIADLQQKVQELVSRSEGPGKERREDELKKFRHNIDVAENGTRLSP